MTLAQILTLIGGRSALARALTASGHPISADSIGHWASVPKAWAGRVAKVVAGLRKDAA